MTGKLIRDRLVVEMVRNVSEIGLSRLKSLDNGQALFNGKMGGMRAFTQRVDDQHVESFEQRPAGVGYVVDIRAVGDVFEAETEDGQLTMMQANRDEGRS